MNGAPASSAIALCCDRVARRISSYRTSAEVVAVPGGWARLRPGGETGDHIWTVFNRVYWLTVERPLRKPDIDGMVQAMRHHRSRSAFVWTSGAACEGEVDAALRRAGAQPFTKAQCVAMMRRAAPLLPERPSAFHVRAVPTAELPALMQSAVGWYSEDGAATMCRLVELGIAELYSAFVDGAAVAFGALLMDSDEHGSTWGYLGWAGTDPAFRGRGAQTALIASRVSRAAELGAKWCISETGSDNLTSLGNLRRCGFVPAATWLHYHWHDPEPTRGPSKD